MQLLCVVRSYPRNCFGRSVALISECCNCAQARSFRSAQNPIDNLALNEAAQIHLPEIGIRGNTHFPMSDMNNLQIADQMSKFLSEKKLD